MFQLYSHSMNICLCRSVYWPSLFKKNHFSSLLLNSSEIESGDSKVYIKWKSTGDTLYGLCFQVALLTAHQTLLGLSVTWGKHCFFQQNLYLSYSKTHLRAFIFSWQDYPRGKLKDFSKQLFPVCWSHTYIFSLYCKPTCVQLSVMCTAGSQK